VSGPERLVGGYCSKVFRLAELLQYLPCFYDINIEQALTILEVPRDLFHQARAALSVDEEWPLNAIKQGRFRVGWIEVRYCRAMAILNHDTPPRMRISLIQAEEKAVVIRAINMSRFMQARMAETVFPQLPMLNDLLSKEKENYRKYNEHHNRKLQQAVDLREIIHLLIDVPIKYLTRDVLGISNHTLMEARQNTKYANRWPYPWVWGKYKEDGVPTAKEVARQREEALQELNPQSFKARVLSDAARVAQTIEAARQRKTKPGSAAGRKKAAAKKPEEKQEVEVPDHLFEGLEDIAVEEPPPAMPENTEAPPAWFEELPVAETQAEIQPVDQIQEEAQSSSTATDELHFFDNFEFSASQEERQYWESFGTMDGA
jgi:hypothetical protein